MILNSYLVVPPASTGGATWWRVLFTTVNTGGLGAIRFAEIEFIQTRDSGVASGGATQFSSNGSYTAPDSSTHYTADAFDSDLTTWWGSDEAEPYIGLSFGLALEINQVLFTSASDTATYDDVSSNVTIQSSNNSTTGADGTWTDEFTGSITNPSGVGFADSSTGNVYTVTRP